MYSIGIDLGGTNIAGGICNSSGHLVVKKSIPTLSWRGADSIIEDIITQLSHKLNRNLPLI